MADRGRIAGEEHRVAQRVDRDQRRAVVDRRRARDHARRGARVGEVAVRRRDERGELGVLDPAVVVDVGRAEQARDHLVGEHAGLESRPLVRLLARGGRDDHAHGGPGALRTLARGEPLGQRDLRRRRVDLGRAAHPDHGTGVAGVHDQVHVGRRQPPDHVGVQPLARERSIEHREERASLVGEAVAAEREVQHRLVAALHVGGHLAGVVGHDPREVGERRGLRVGAEPGVAPLGQIVEHRQEVGLDREPREQLVVADRVVVRVVQHRQRGRRRGVVADRDRVRDRPGRARARPQDHGGHRDLQRDAPHRTTTWRVAVASPRSRMARTAARSSGAAENTPSIA